MFGFNLEKTVFGSHSPPSDAAALPASAAWKVALLRGVVHSEQEALHNIFEVDTSLHQTAVPKLSHTGVEITVNLPNQSAPANAQKMLLLGRRRRPIQWHQRCKNMQDKSLHTYTELPGLATRKRCPFTRNGD